MYIETVPNRGSRPAILLRESYREGGRVRKRTLANLSDYEPARIAALRAALRGGGDADAGAAAIEDAFDVVRSVPHGHVAAVLGAMRRIGLPALLARRPSRERELTLAVIAARILEPRSKLATARGLRSDTIESSLSEMLGLGDPDEDAIYAAMDWAVARQSAVETELARRHLKDGSVVLYDVTSSYFEGTHCKLAARGYSRDGKKGLLQIVIGLLCDAEGLPVAVEVFPGNTGDPTTVSSQVAKLRERFGIARVILVGDRGMLTSARIEQDLRPAVGIQWITALRGPAIRALLERGEIQLSLFDERDLAEITSAEFPGERLVVCRNPLLAADRARTRKELLEATEKKLAEVRAAVDRKNRPLRSVAKITARADRVLRSRKMAKHFKVDVGRASISWSRIEENINAEAAVDGLYVVRTSVAAEELPADAAVRTYKRLSQVERAFRSLKTVDLKIRPIHHRLEVRVRAHVFLCMLAYHVEWHMRRDLAPVIFDDEDRAASEARRASVVAPAERSESADLKAHTRLTADGAPVHDFQGLLRDLATICRNRVQPRAPELPAFVKTTVPTPLQRRALELLKVAL